ncbi:chymotrypsin-like protease CTRL-1 [Wyeomyia smithii]|uniref:chymotrypsin-like protease CTRL-1 n=1 Tax=Wyeomyia smithii TaxID=174621 RepID=UPI002467E05F|nr:chymotrypsin-like protease CTRL-1 [Wyeomyia smithii]
MIDRIVRSLFFVSLFREGLPYKTNESWVPFVVSLENNEGKFCAGCFVGASWIVTVASCVRNKQPNEFSVRIPPRNSDSHTGYHTKVERIIIHSEYESSKELLEFNVALLKLRRPAVFENYSLSIDIAKDSFYSETLLQCLLADTRDQDQVLDAQVKYIRLRPSQACNGKLKSKICADNFEDRLCEFNKGSPLLCQDGNHFLLTGLLAGPVQCLHQNVSEVFLGVNAFETWINSILDGGNLANPTNLTPVNYSMRLSQFNWMIIAVSFFILSATIFIMVLRSGFKAR